MVAQFTSGTGEIAPNLHVGGAFIWKTLNALHDNIAVLSCAKDPWHRDMVGYTRERPLPRDHPEYLFAQRGNRATMNMVDAPDARYFSREMIDAGLKFMTAQRMRGQVLVVHCNEGLSRGPSMAFLHLLRRGELSREYTAALNEFRVLYPAYSPGAGIEAFIRQNWSYYGGK